LANRCDRVIRLTDGQIDFSAARAAE
jgi:predicted ABC-type transport system involved in lysophospholipase L1 biosynthesis ATPase subunit